MTGQFLKELALVLLDLMLDSFFEGATAIGGGWRDAGQEAGSAFGVWEP